MTIFIGIYMFIDLKTYYEFFRCCPRDSPLAQQPERSPCYDNFGQRSLGIQPFYVQIAIGYVQFFRALEALLVRSLKSFL